MRVVIIGGGEIGEALASLLIKEKHDVIIVEKDEKRAEELASKIDALILHGDATDEVILRDADIEHADAVVVATSDDKTNLLVCEIIKNRGVKRIISRLNNTTNEPIFLKLGIESVINTTNVTLSAFKKSLETGGRKHIALVASDKVEIFEIVVPDNSKVIGKKIKKIEKDFRIGLIYRNGELIIPDEEKTLESGDIIILIAPVEKIDKVENVFGLKGQ